VLENKEKCMNALQTEISLPSLQEETDSSWEVESSAGSEFLSESSEESDYEDDRAPLRHKLQRKSQSLP